MCAPSRSLLPLILRGLSTCRAARRCSAPMISCQCAMVAIVFVSNQSARAVMAAYWYRQMGFKNVSVLQGGLEAWRAGARPLVSGADIAAPLGFESAQRSARIIAAAELRKTKRRSGVDSRCRFQFGFRKRSHSRSQVDFPRLDRRQSAGAIFRSRTADCVDLCRWTAIDFGGAPARRKSVTAMSGSRRRRSALVGCGTSNRRRTR